MNAQAKSQSGLDHDVSRGHGSLAIEVLESVSAAVVVVDHQLRIEYRNASARTMMGEVEFLDAALGGAEFLGRFDGWSREVSQVLASGASRQFVCALCMGEETRPVLRQGSISRLGGADHSAGRAVVWFDVYDTAAAGTEQVEITHRLASLGKLAARVAHELNNPLDGILRYINLALRTLDDSTEPKVTSYLAESRTGLKRMAQIIGDLLEFSRSTDGEFDDVAIHDVIERAIQAHAKQAADHRVVVAVDFQTLDMPSIRGGRLFQVISNLIKNALDAMPDGGQLTITSGVVSGEVVIRVADTGPGLSHSPQEVFEAFFTTKEAGKGTGLGLAICRDFIEDMGGCIQAATSSNGALFTVRLPLDRCRSPRSDGIDSVKEE